MASCTWTSMYLSGLIVSSARFRSPRTFILSYNKNNGMSVILRNSAFRIYKFYCRNPNYSRLKLSGLIGCQGDRRSRQPIHMQRYLMMLAQYPLPAYYFQAIFKTWKDMAAKCALTAKSYAHFLWGYRASEIRDKQTEVRTPFSRPQYILPLTIALLTSYTVSAHYASYKAPSIILPCRALTQWINVKKGLL